MEPVPLRQLSIPLAWLCLLPVALAAVSPGKSNRTPPTADYVTALATANRFLEAWQAGDHEAGLLLLSDEARRHSTEQKLQDFFDSRPGVRQAFEIRGGVRLKSGAYRFPVTLLEFDARSGHAKARSRSGALVVARSGKNDWVVNGLP